MPCQKGCCRQLARFRNGTLRYMAPAWHGGAETREARRIAVPGPLVAEFRALVACTTLKHDPPTFELYDSLGGVGGLFSFDNWVVMVGFADMQEIATRLISENRDELLRIFIVAHGRFPERGELNTYVRGAAIRRCVAHELGHALIANGADNPFGRDEEAGADYYAGQLDHARGRNPRLGELFFSDIGCEGATCTHPTPAKREYAYRRGFNLRRRAA